MLELKSICKQYKTGDLVQTALDHVSVTFRDSEFVAVLGPSGSGKTTLLNVIGGLDRYDSGDLVIRGISTTNYRDRDWDSYRNHSIGFVFQSYNLIPHQSILSNVELSLTISGVSRRERTERAKKALDEVGLLDQRHKRPNQLSGGQMQRVAIARALVNDPDIVLADEPTGALDSETSVQVMELLKEVAKNRLVVMVTHNGELAEQYATRIVRLRDGKITDDSDPAGVTESSLSAAAGLESEEKGASAAGGSRKKARRAAKAQNMGKSSMSFATSLQLSFTNLRTKKARTILTAFAGSIGIIGIALILSLSTGVNLYIEQIQKETMTSYPITITAQTIDLESLMNAGRDRAEAERDHDLDAVYANTYMFDMASTTMTTISENNLTAFKKFLDDEDNPIHNYLGETGIQYSYDLNFDVYARDPEGELVNTNGMRRNGGGMGGFSGMGYGSALNSRFAEMLPGSSELVSQAVKDNYDLLYGTWPENYDEVVLVINENNEFSMERMYDFGLLPHSEYEKKMQALANGETIENEKVSFSYEELCGKAFYLIPECSYYLENGDGTFARSGRSALELSALAENAIELKISGIIRSRNEDGGVYITGAAGYTKALSEYLMDYIAESPVVQAQKADPGTNILTGYSFSAADDESKAEDAMEYLLGLSASEKAEMIRQYIQGASGLSGMIGGEADEDGREGSESSENGEGSEGSGSGSASAMLGMLGNMSDERLAAMFDQYLKQRPDETMLLQVYDTYLGGGSYDANLQAFGLVDPGTPSAINIYADSFEDKDGITDAIKAYNQQVSKEDEIIYTDYVGLLMSSVTTIINLISYVLIAFVSVSLIVSSIMIGIITYISVLERTKEIGILRAIGASKRNVSQVFNAETFIIGLMAGLLGVVVSRLILIPANSVIHRLAESDKMNAVLPLQAAVILVILSMVLTIIAGFIPSRKAARMDPVAALKTE